MIEIGFKNKVLRGRAKEVEKVDQSIRELIRRMRKIMYEADGIGLAAPQIGLPIRVFVAEPPKRPGSAKARFYSFINPEIVKFSEEKDMLEEGCLSLPGLHGPVERPSRVTLVGLDQHGKKVKIKASGILARIFQHEMDHLNGILFADKARKLYGYRMGKEKAR